MNLNIAIDRVKISEELAARCFLNITMSEDGQEAVLRGTTLPSYIARTGNR